jgi:hypothetical protein
LEEFVQLFSTSPLAKEASEMLKLMNKW